MDPGSAAFGVTLSDFLVQTGDMDAALEEAVAVVERNPADCRGLEHLAHVHALRSEFEAAEQAVGRALKLEPVNRRLLRKQYDLRVCRERAVAA